MRSRSFTIIGVFFAVMLVVVVIRSLLHPVQSVTLFIEHKDDAAWSPALSNTLFQEASIDFAGYQPIQLAGDDLGAWDEVVVMSFDSKENYRSFVGGLATDKTVRRYHLLEVLPQAPELLAFLNWRLRTHRDDKTIDPGESVPIADIVPDQIYLDRWLDMFRGDYRDSIVMLNLLTYAKNPQVGGPKTDATAEELYERYSEKATRVLGKLGGQIAVLGEVDDVKVGPQIRNHDVYAFVYYPSVDVLEVMFTAKERVDAQAHQRAGLSAEGSAGYWVKPYPEFIISGQGNI